MPEKKKQTKKSSPPIKKKKGHAAKAVKGKSNAVTGAKAVKGKAKAIKTKPVPVKAKAKAVKGKPAGKKPSVVKKAPAKKPVKPVKIVKPVKPVKPVKSVISIKPAKAVKPVKPVKPVKTIPARPSAKKETVEERMLNLKRFLVQKREDIVKEAHVEIAKYIRGENRQLVETALDDGDWSVIDLSEDINLRKLDTHRQNLLRIDEALRKLREGTYGICEDCGDEINAERLRILPFAIYCRDCQEKREQLEAAEREFTPPHG